MLGVMSEQDNLSDKNSLVQSQRLAPMHYFSQPIFLLDRSMNLLESNLSGEQAIESNIVRLIAGKLHLSSPKQDLEIATAIKNLCAAETNADKPNISSKRFVFLTSNLQYHAFKLSVTKPDSSVPDSGDILLSITQEITECSAADLECLSNAFSLSTCEINILKLMIRSLKPKEIAYEDGVSLNTVRFHLRTIYAKMQVNSFNEALVTAVRLMS